MAMVEASLSLDLTFKFRSFKRGFKSDKMGGKTFQKLGGMGYYESSRVWGKRRCKLRVMEAQNRDISKFWKFNWEERSLFLAFSWLGKFSNSMEEPPLESWGWWWRNERVWSLTIYAWLKLSIKVWEGGSEEEVLTRAQGYEKSLEIVFRSLLQKLKSYGGVRGRWRGSFQGLHGNLLLK